MTTKPAHNETRSRGGRPRIDVAVLIDAEKFSGMSRAKQLQRYHAQRAADVLSATPKGQDWRARQSWPKWWTDAALAELGRVADDPTLIALADRLSRNTTGYDAIKQLQAWKRELNTSKASTGGQHATSAD